MYEQPGQEGMVLEHREIASEFLGRALKPGECVHHKDENKANNSTDNLMVFATSGDHTAYHKGGELVPIGDGSYKTERRGSKRKPKASRKFRDPAMRICPCGNAKSVAAALCVDCYKTTQAKDIPAKEALEKLLWQIPTVQIAQQYGVSDVAVSKWCKRYGLTKPPRGWWTGSGASANVGELGRSVKPLSLD